MSRVLVIYATTDGHTAKVADNIGQIVREAGHEVEVADCARLPGDFSLAPYDGVILGGSVRYGRHQKTIKRFARRHHAEFAAKHSAFFSVSGAASSPTDRPEAERLAQQFLAGVGWQPDLVGVFGGAILFTKYGPVTRLVMKMIAKRHGAGTDTSRDFEYTDWSAVRSFGETFLAGLAKRQR